MAQQWTPCDCCKAKIRKVTEPFERAIQELNIRKRVEQCSDNTREVQVKLLELYTERLKQLQDILLLSNHRYKQKLGVKEDEVRRSNTKVKRLQQKICDLNTLIEKDAQKLNVREDEVRRSNDKVKQLQQEIRDLTTKSETDAQRIANDGSKIQKLQHNQEVSRLEIRRRDESIKQLQEELMDYQAQYSACYNELLKTQNYIQQLKTKSCVNQATQASSQESSQLQDQLLMIKQELAISREIHRTCQREVATRDQEIQKLQTDLSMTQGKYIGCMEGLNIREDKVIRLNDKVTELQIEILDLSAKIEGDSQKIAYGENTIRKFQHNEEIFIQELMKTQNYIQQLKTKSCVNQATQASSQESSQLQDQLLMIKQELAISREKHRTCQKEVGTRDQEIQKLQTDLSMAQGKYIGCMEGLNIREDKVIRLNDKVTELQIEILDLSAKIEGDSQKVRRRDESIKQLQEELLDSQAQYSDCHIELNIREDKVVRLNDKVTQLQIEILDHSSQIKGDSQKVSDGEKTIQELQHDQEITKGSLKEIVGMYHARGKQDIETIRKHQSTISHLMEEIRSLHCALNSQRDQNRQLEHSMQQMEDHQEERSLHHEMDFQQARMIITQLQRKLGQTEADHDEEINHLKLTFEERLRYHLPLSVRQDLEDTIKALKSQNKSLQQKVVILQEWLDELS